MTDQSGKDVFFLISAEAYTKLTGSPPPGGKPMVDIVMDSCTATALMQSQGIETPEQFRAMTNEEISSTFELALLRQCIGEQSN
jgi:hypothetical protein